jgi:hypothetical protein
MSCANDPTPASTPASHSDATGYVELGPHKRLTTVCLNFHYEIGFCDSDRHTHTYTIGDTIIFIVKESEAIEHVYMDSITKAYGQDTTKKY